MTLKKFLLLAFVLLLLPVGLASAATLTVIKVGTGYGDVDGEDISCGPFCSATYQEKSVIHLKASPYDDSTFEGWMVNGKPHEGVIVIDQEDILITARFDLNTPLDESTVMWYDGNDTEYAMMVLDEIAVFPAQRPDSPYVLEGEYKTALEDVARIFHPQAKIKEWGDFAVILESPEPVSRELLSEIFETISAHEYIRQAGPVLYGNPNNPDSQVIPTGEILVEFPASYSKDQILAIEQKYGLVRLKRGGDDLHDALYQAGTPIESIEIANLLYESGLVEYSSPELIMTTIFFNQLLEKDSFPDHWHLTGQNGADVIGAWNLNDKSGTPIRGSGVVIAILDDGVEIHHPDLSPNINEELCFDFVDSWGWGKEVEDRDPTPPINLAELQLPPDISFDEFKVLYGGHGTSVAGTAAAAIEERSDWKGIFGVAPEAQIVGYRLLGFRIGEEGQEINPVFRGKNPDKEALIRNRDKIHIYNRSLGSGARHLRGYRKKIQTELKNSVIAGSIFVNSAGNDREEKGNANYNGYSTSRYAFAIAASTKEGTYADYSNPGANILVNAPCSGIPATDRMGGDGKNPFMDWHNTDYQDFDYTNSFSGTSAAAPVVSGVIALMLQANPKLDWRDVQHILIETADKNLGEDWGDEDHLNKAGYSHSYNYGFGRINAKKAVEAALLWKEDTVPDELEPITDENTKRETILPNGELTEDAGIIEIEENMKIEFVEVFLDVKLNPQFGAQHRRWCDLEVVLTSPTKTISVLSPTSSCYTDEMSIDEQYGFKNWRFGSVRHFGEPSEGK